MAQIITYPKLSTLADKDLLLVSDVSSKNKTTNSLEVDTLAQYIITTNSLIKGGGSFNRIPLFTPTGAEIGNSIMIQSLGDDEIKIGGDLLVNNNAKIDNNLEVDGDLTLNGVGTFDSITQFFGQATFEDEANFQSTIKDQFSNPGTAGQVLSSTGSNVEWIDNTSGGGGIGGSGTVNTIAMFTPDGTTIGDSPITNPSFSNIELGGSLTIGQFSYLYWGNNSSDRLSIQNNISGSDIRQTGSGALSIQCDSEVSISAAAAIGGSEALAKFKENGPIELYYDNVKTFETTSAGAQVLGDFTLLDTTTSNPVILSLSEQTVGEQFQGAFLNLRARETSTNTETRGVVVAHGPNSINTGGAGNVVVQNQTPAGGQVVIAPKSGPVGNPPQSITYFNRFKENGQVQFPGYGSGTLTGTAAYNLSVDLSGNLIETANPPTTTGEWRVLSVQLSGNLLASQFNGNLSDKITLVTVPSNTYAKILEVTGVIYGASTGTTNYNPNNSLYVKKDGSITGGSFNSPEILGTFLSSGSDSLTNSNGQPVAAQVNALSTYGGLGADIVLGPSNTGPVNITQGDRTILLSVTYRLINFTP